ncbi:MAG TPA: glycosyltransferase [Acidimicrobiales bacterium]|nr:glycosyltransferase [Acidimicrobiales bacterium]
MSTAPRVVVVSHEATLTGAPRVAVEVVRALGGEDRTVVAVLRAGGPLTPAFEAAADGLRQEPLARARAGLRRVGALRPLVNRLDELVAGYVLRRERPTALFLNTVKSACYVRPALRRGIPVALLSHELGTLASSVLRRYPLGHRWRDVRLLACSAAARDTLAPLVGVATEDIEVVTSPVDVQAVVAAAGTRTHEPTGPVVGGCGTVNERKGVDLWLQVAKAVQDQRPDLGVRFRWVGERKGDWLDEGDIGNGVELTGQVADPYPLIAGMDVFTLPSREDAFPLAVMEAMALSRPIVAFDVGGVRDQLGDAGVIVAAGDTDAMAAAVVRLLDDPDAARALGEAAATRARELHDVAPFHQAIRDVVTSLRPKPTKAFLLKSWHAGDAHEQRYRIELLERHGVDLRYSDAVDRPPWTFAPVRKLVRRLERLGAPFLQTLLAAPRIARSDAVVAVFESQGNFLAGLRALRLWPFTRPRFVVVACWLAMDAPKFSPRKLRGYRWAYRRGVDELVFFSPNQTEVYRDLLGIPEDRLAYVPFGIDHQYFTPRDVEEEGYVLAVGRDKGRDWPTLFDAVRGTDLDVRVVCRPDDIEGLDVPANVTLLGTVDRSTYRDLTARARVVVVATRPLAYPTGQSVTLESMALGKCCVVTDTPAMHDYLDHEVDALLVPPHDSAALRAALERAMTDPDLRKRLGTGAREAVERTFNAAAMWQTVAGHLRRVNVAGS